MMPEPTRARKVKAKASRLVLPHSTCAILRTRQALRMKRFLFLVCGVGLILIAGGRLLVILADTALAPDTYRATARIELHANTSVPQNSLELSGKILSTLATPPKFVEQLASEKHHTANLTEAEAIRWLQKFTVIIQDPASRAVLLTYYGYDSDNTASVANVLARAWVEKNSPAAKIVPASAQVAHAPLAGFFKSPQVVILLLATLAGAVVFWLGWRMPTPHVSNPVAPLVIEAKY